MNLEPDNDNDIDKDRWILGLLCTVSGGVVGGCLYFALRYALTHACGG